MKLSTLLVLVGLLIGMSGCGFINKLRAKNSLNEGVRAFNGGHYDQAQDLFADALKYNPENTDAQLFYARAINARFEQNQTEELGLKALDAYQNIINHNQNNPKAVDQALAFEAKAYEDLASAVPEKNQEYKDKARETLLKRADMPGATNKTKADVYYTIGQGYWQESYSISKQFTKTQATGRIDSSVPATSADKMKAAILKAHEYLQKALAIEPDYADAWIYEKLVYLEETKVDPASMRAELEKKMNEDQENYKKYHEQQQAAQSGAAQ
ncbi:MAG TPA: hypothetical protein VI756_15265 [Blastocatellia bacterium]